jgi:hypothetical protein
MIGTANHKTEQSPFQVGEQVEVTIKGQTPRGMTKIGLSKPQQQGGQQGGYPAPQQAQPAQGYQHPPSQPQAPQQARKAGPIGVTVGMAINNAVQLVCHGQINLEEIGKEAGKILRLAEALESGAANRPAPVQPMSLPAQMPSNMQPVQPVQPVNQANTYAPPVDEVDEDDIPF